MQSSCCRSRAVQEPARKRGRRREPSPSSSDDSLSPQERPRRQSRLPLKLVADYSNSLADPAVLEVLAQDPKHASRFRKAPGPDRRSEATLSEEQKSEPGESPELKPLSGRAAGRSTRSPGSRRVSGERSEEPKSAAVSAGAAVPLSPGAAVRSRSAGQKRKATTSSPTVSGARKAAGKRSPAAVAAKLAAVPAVGTVNPAPAERSRNREAAASRASSLEPAAAPECGANVGVQQGNGRVEGSPTDPAVRCEARHVVGAGGKGSRWASLNQMSSRRTVRPRAEGGLRAMVKAASSGVSPLFAARGGISKRSPGGFDGKPRGVRAS